MSRLWVLALAMLLSGCSSARRVEPARAEAGEAPSGSSDAAGPGAEVAPGDAASRDGEAQGRSSHTVAPGTPLDAREPDPKRALPKVSVRHIGMHIGGDPNTPESKRPFLQTIERGEGAFLRCYRLVSAPAKGGTFGADLFVGSSGGAPEVRAVRHKLGGDDLAACMTAAFIELRFPAPARPTMVSYSMRFDVE